MRQAHLRNLGVPEKTICQKVYFLKGAILYEKARIKLYIFHKITKLYLTLFSFYAKIMIDIDNLSKSTHFERGKTMKKRILSLFLAIAIIIEIVPMTLTKKTVAEQPEVTAGNLGNITG